MRKLGATSAPNETQLALGLSAREGQLNMSDDIAEYHASDSS